MQSPIINLDQVIKNMSELNHLVTENEREVEYDGNGGARFNRAAVVAVTFYLDGFTVDRGRFRSYAETASQTFLKDLTDGFFPAEMQVQYSTLLTQKPLMNFNIQWCARQMQHNFL